MPELVRCYISEKKALTGYWKFVFAGLIDNKINNVEDSIKNIGQKWIIVADL
mgnify:FL=1